MDPALLEDLTELQRIRGYAERPNVQKYLEVRIAELLKMQQQFDSSNGLSHHDSNSQASSQSKSHHPVNAPSSNVLPMVKLTTYAWDQSDKYVKIYVTIPGAEAVPSQNLSVEFTKNSFFLTVHNAAGKNYEMTIKGLLNEIDGKNSSAKQKKDTVLLMLKKVKENTNWDTVTQTEKQAKDKKTPKFDKDSDPQDSLMTMMKQMYDEGDDEMKRTIRKSWHESQAKKGAGAGGDMMGGMGGGMGGGMDDM